MNIWFLFIIFRKRHRAKHHALFCSPRGQHLIQSVVDGAKVSEIVPKLGLRSNERRQVDRFVARIRENGWGTTVLMVNDNNMLFIYDMLILFVFSRRQPQLLLTTH